MIDRTPKPTKAPRFVTKFNNGVWKVFDNSTFSDVSLEPRRREADERCAWMNNPPARSPRA